MPCFDRKVDDGFIFGTHSSQLFHAAEAAAETGGHDHEERFGGAVGVGHETVLPRPRSLANRSGRREGRIPPIEPGSGHLDADGYHRTMGRTMPRPVSGRSSRSMGDSAVLVAAVTAIASSALLVRWADAPAVALAFWRTLGGATLLALLSAVRSTSTEPRGRGPVATEGSTRTGRKLLVAGLALAAHFAAWLASLEMTSVAASVTLVATAPLMIALYQTVRGQTPRASTWLALLLAVAGTGLITFGDVSQPAPVGAGGDDEILGLSRALQGDILALIGAAAMAVYLVVGADLRRSLSTAEYTWRAYAVAATGLGAVALVFRSPLSGFDRTTWAAIIAMTLGPQLIGHTGLNHLLRRLGSLTVSLALLTEPVAASALVWLVLGEIPSPTSLLGAPLVLGAIALHLLASANRTDTLDPAGDTHDSSHDSARNDARFDDGAHQPS